MSRQYLTSGDSVSIGTPAVLNNVIPFSWVAWVDATSYGIATQGRILEKALGVAAGGKVLYLDSGAGGTINGLVHYSVQNAQAIASWPASRVGSDLWKFVAMTFKTGDGGPRLWLGDFVTPVAEMSYSTRAAESGSAADDSSQNLLIGSASVGAHVFGGRIAHVSMWSGVLTQANLDAIRKTPWVPFTQKNHAPATLLGFWPLDDNNLTQALEYSGAGLNGTAVGGAKSNQPARETMGSSGW